MEYQTEQHGDPDKILKSKLEREKAKQKRARTIALVFGAIATLALIALVYAFVQKRSADEQMNLTAKTMKLADSLKVQLGECQKGARLGQIVAERARMQADSLSKLSTKMK